MDPVTHAVIGMSIAKAAGHDAILNDPVTAGIIIGSMFPDLDILMQKWGDYVYLKNHRGASHSIFGLMASALLITGVLKLIYPGAGTMSIFLWTLAGCFSHTIIDLFNSYGAKLLWPFLNKRVTFGLLVVFDPVFLALLSGYAFTGPRLENKFLYAFGLYLLVRVLMRLYLLTVLKRKFNKGRTAIRLLPSATGIFRWHFILERERCHLVGEKNLFKRKFRIIRKLYKLQDDNMLDAVLDSHVGTFFKEFTPAFHVVKERIEGLNRYVFIDLRYFMKNNFLHHAVLEMDGNSSITRQSFNPYSINRSNDIKY